MFLTTKSLLEIFWWLTIEQNEACKHARLIILMVGHGCNPLYFSHISVLIVTGNTGFFIEPEIQMFSIS